MILQNEKGVPDASIFYTAYFAKQIGVARRPILFLYNGGPGSSTAWLHIGAFGPKRVITSGETHTQPAPYKLVDNEYSLLDSCDLVFIDAPGAGFSSVVQQGVTGSRYYTVDGDASAFSEFISSFIDRYGLWNSPKFLFGESFGTARTALVANILQSKKSIDLNGIIFLSLALDINVLPTFTGDSLKQDLVYELVLPSYAASAWYHHLLSKQYADLKSLLTEVEQFALSDYANALARGNRLDASAAHAIAVKIHSYTGLPIEYIERSNLRIGAGEFEHELLSEKDLTTSGVDARFSGPTVDKLEQFASYDPQASSISSAYALAFNDYASNTLKYKGDSEFHLFAQGDGSAAPNGWKFEHTPPGSAAPIPGFDTKPDLSAAMNNNPCMNVMLNSGYFDLLTPYFGANYQMDHLLISPKLIRNIETHYYESGHLVYVNLSSLAQLHDNVKNFMSRTLANSNTNCSSP